MILPNKAEAKILLETYVTDNYQRYHALMVATAVAGYARDRGQDELLWWLTGYLHDIDYNLYPTKHPGPSLQWFADWGYPPELIQAVLAHAVGFNGFTKKPETSLDYALLANDEICGIFYAYYRLNPIPFIEMKHSSIKKRFNELRFAPGINREHILQACAGFEVTLDEHIANLIHFFAELPEPVLPNKAN